MNNYIHTAMHMSDRHEHADVFLDNSRWWYTNLVLIPFFGEPRAYMNGGRYRMMTKTDAKTITCHVNTVLDKSRKV